MKWRQDTEFKVIVLMMSNCMKKDKETIKKEPISNEEYNI